ncbi:MAG: M67 family metallopeptidase [Gemmatimonadota bacterium]
MVEGGQVIRIDEQAARDMARQAEAAYPEECCGALLGRDGESREVARSVPAPNTTGETRTRRYLIAPETVRDLERTAEADGLQVVGYYHSHPDHPARPSETDERLAWPWYSYVIVPVSAGVVGAPRAWRLRDDRTGFDEQEIA